MPTLNASVSRWAGLHRSEDCYRGNDVPPPPPAGGGEGRCSPQGPVSFEVTKAQWVHQGAPLPRVLLGAGKCSSRPRPFQPPGRHQDAGLASRAAPPVPLWVSQGAPPRVLPTPRAPPPPGVQSWRKPRVPRTPRAAFVWASTAPLLGPEHGRTQPPHNRQLPPPRPFEKMGPNFLRPIKHSLASGASNNSAPPREGGWGWTPPPSRPPPTSQKEPGHPPPPSVGTGGASSYRRGTPRHRPSRWSPGSTTSPRGPKGQGVAPTRAEGPGT